MSNFARKHKVDILVLFYCIGALIFPQCAFSHLWIVKTMRYSAGIDSNACLARAIIAAQNIKQKMKDFGYSPGDVLQDGKIVRLDGIGTRGTSLLMYCTDYSVYLITAHSTDDDRKSFSELNRLLLDQMRDTLE